MDSLSRKIAAPATRVALSCAQGVETVADRVGDLTRSDQVTEIMTGVTGMTLQLQPHLDEKIGLFQHCLDTLVTGEGFFSDLLVTAGEVANSKLKSFASMLKGVARFALDSGLAAAVPIGLGALGPPLLMGGARQLAKGIKERELLPAIQGGRKMVLAGELGAAATQIAPGLAGTALSRAVSVAVAPLAIVQIALDTAQGTYQVVQGARKREGHTVANGVSDLAMATALTVGMAAGPAAALPIACAALALKIVNGRLRARKERQQTEGQVTTRVPAASSIDFTGVLTPELEAWPGTPSPINNHYLR